MYIDDESVEGYAPAMLVTDEMIRANMLEDADLAWTSDNIERVRTRREAMSGLLFFDILLQLGGIENAQEIFPPEDRDGLALLLDAIEDTSYDHMKRDCLKYYLIKYLMNASEVKFASQQMLAAHYASIADAYWLLDNGVNLDNAITHLSDVRIIKEYSSKIMETLALDFEGSRLIRRFVRTCSPSLKEPEDGSRYLLALAEHSVVDAWEYQKKYPESVSAKKMFIHNLLTWILSPKPKQEPLKLLLAMSMSRYEEKTLREYAEKPPEELPAASASVMRDMVCVRLIQQCKYVDAVKFDRRYPPTVGTPRGTWGAERGRIIKDVMAVLPAVERRLLEAELDSLDNGAAPPTATSSGASWTEVRSAGSSTLADLSASWEDIGHRAPRRTINRPRTSLANGSAKQPFAMLEAPRSQPLSAYPTLVVPSNSAPLLSSTLNLQSTLQISASTSMPTKVSVNGTSHVNGKTNGTQKSNAFMMRNAFYNPPERSSSPDELNIISAGRQRSPPKGAPERSFARTPTPPQDEPERVRSEEESRDEASVDGIMRLDNNENERPVVSDREEGNLGFSLFGRRAPAPRPVSPRRPRSPPPLAASTRQKSPKLYPSVDDIIEVEVRQKSPHISVPGAFVNDEDEIERQEEVPPSSKGARASLSASATHRRSVAHAAQTPRRSTRKRAASPAESADDNAPVRMSIPGGLFDEDEDGDGGDPPAAHTRRTSRRNAQRTDDEHEHENENETEAEDDLAPLPSQRSRRKTASNANVNASPAKARGGRGSRAGSLEPENAGLDRSLRRSSRRLGGVTSVSPTEDIGQRVGSTRPRKSTRTAGTGATATGKGAAKRR